MSTILWKRIWSMVAIILAVSNLTSKFIYKAAGTPLTMSDVVMSILMCLILVAALWVNLLQGENNE